MQRNDHVRPIIGITCDLDPGTGRETRTPGRKAHVLADDYVQAILSSGGIPVLFPAVVGHASRTVYVEHCHGLVIPGSPADVDPACYGEEPHPRLGPVNPRRIDFEMEVTRLALRRGRPVFGICGGAQVLNVALGGSLYQDIPSQIPKAYKHSASPEPVHTVDVVPGTRLAAILGRHELRVNSMHHQAAKVPGQGLVVCASARDGVIEAVEITDQPFVIGVQWHPERLYREDEAAARLFTAFVQAATAQ
jgi:putative glutamine amidotransferase